MTTLHPNSRMILLLALSMVSACTRISAEEVSTTSEADGQAIAVVRQPIDTFDTEIAEFRLLFCDPAVKKELGITREQKAKINALVDQFNETQQALALKDDAAYQSAQLAPEAVRPTHFDQSSVEQQSFNAFRKGVLGAMTPNQLKRLREITLQGLDVILLTRPPLSTKLNMSKAQISEINSILGRLVIDESSRTAALSNTFWKNHQPGSDAERERMQRELRELDTEAALAKGDEVRRTVYELLAPAQLEALTDLKGAPFKFQPPHY